MQKRITGAAIAGVILAVLVGILVTMGGHEGAIADDTYHTTNLTQTTWDFGSGNVSAAYAIMGSTDTQDATFEIHMYCTPSGGSERLCGFASAARADGMSSTNVAVGTAGMSSGTQIRAHFETFDSGGSRRFSFNRTTTLP